jgi:hypothetical protein
MNYTPINLEQKFGKFAEHWSPRVECRVMLTEPSGVVNTGDAPGRAYTAANDVWV